MPSFSLTPGGRNLAALDAATRGRPAGFRESAEVQDSCDRKAAMPSFP